MFGMENIRLMKSYLHKYREVLRDSLKTWQDNLIKIRTYCNYLLAVVGSAVLFCSCDLSKSPGGIRKPRLTPKYSSRDKEPMGSYIAYHYLSSLFNNGVTNAVDKSFSHLRYEIDYDNKSLYIIIAKGVFMNNADVESIMNYVSNGNTAFISAEYIDQKLLDTLGVKATFDFSSFFFSDEYGMEKSDTWLTIADDQKRYGFYFVPFDNSVIDYDSAATQVLGYNEDKEPNFIAVDHGAGKFVIHTAPAAFSNYFLLRENNKEYLEKAFSYFDPGTSSVYWDNYYRSKRSTEDNFSIIGFFKKHPPLWYAFLIVMSGLLLFIAFGGKRRQRFVPEKTPNTNTTVSYTETIGRLYLQKKDNRNIALKMFTYFLEYVRNHYYLNTQNLNNEFAEALSRKSGVPKPRVRHLLQLMDETEHSDNINDIRLLELHNHLQEYFKK
jgi:hypothetical protein